MKELHDKVVSVFVVWEPVLLTDWGEPSSAALKRIQGDRVLQFWDKGRLLSHAMGEHGEESIVWDHIAVYARGAEWNDTPPKPLWEGRPVVKVIEPARSALTRALIER